MNTIRERDSWWQDYRQSPDSASPSADRRALLATGDALVAAAWASLQEPGRDREADALRAAIFAWKGAAG
jgi:hypothetical protein